MNRAVESIHHTERLSHCWVKDTDNVCCFLYFCTDPCPNSLCLTLSSNANLRNSICNTSLLKMLVYHKTSACFWHGDTLKVSCEGPHLPKRKQQEYNQLRPLARLLRRVVGTDSASLWFQGIVEQISDLLKYFKWGLGGRACGWEGGKWFDFQLVPHQAEVVGALWKQESRVVWGFLIQK